MFSRFSSAWLLVGWIVLGGIGCSASSESHFGYPTQEERDSQWICEQIYGADYVTLLGAAREKRVRKITPVDSSQILAQFSDGKQVLLPISSSLPTGQDFYCGKPEKHYSCIPGTNQDAQCTRIRPTRKTE